MAVPRRPTNRIQDPGETTTTDGDRHNTLELNGLNPIQTTPTPNTMPTAQSTENTANDDSYMAKKIDNQSGYVHIRPHDSFGGVTSTTSNMGFTDARSHSIFGSLAPREVQLFGPSKLEILTTRAQAQARRIVSSTPIKT